MIAYALGIDKLHGSKYGSPDAVDHITKRFDETTKRLFRDSRDPQFVPFGSPLDKDLSVGIRSGQLKLTGDEVAALFEPSIKGDFRARLPQHVRPTKCVYSRCKFYKNSD